MTDKTNKTQEKPQMIREMFCEQCKFSRIEIVCLINENLLLKCGNCGKLSQIFLNLTINEIPKLKPIEKNTRRYLG